MFTWIIVSAATVVSLFSGVLGSAEHWSAIGPIVVPNGKVVIEKPIPGSEDLTPKLRSFGFSIRNGADQEEAIELATKACRESIAKSKNRLREVWRARGYQIGLIEEDFKIDLEYCELRVRDEESGGNYYRAKVNYNGHFTLHLMTPTRRTPA